MSLIKLHRTFSKLKHCKLRLYSQAALIEENEYTETPEYPPIQDLSIDARRFRKREEVREKIKKLNTVEEKQIALNMPRYYGFKCVMLHEDKVPYNAMAMVKYYTKSHYVPIDKLPNAYSELEPEADAIAKEIKPMIEESILMENELVEHNFTFNTEKPEAQQKENAVSRSIVKQINRVLTNRLAKKHKHIMSAQVDLDPRHEAFWFVGGIAPPQNVMNWRKQYKWLDQEESVDRPVQYIGSPLLAVRSHLPLKPLIPYSEAENPAFAVPKIDYQPQAFLYGTEHRHGTNMPGFWPGDVDEFGLLSYHGRGDILERSQFGAEDNIEALHCKAMKASFGWLLSQANYQGFTTYNDITYPLVTQTVVTNGQLWSLYAYQLNTIVLHNDALDNPKSNILFGTDPLKLYESIEDGKLHGFNEDVLKMIVQLYLNAPEKREYDMKPYLNKEEQVIADIEDDNKRSWLERTYKRLASNRPRHLLTPEIYHWEHIYKIKFKTRFFEAKRRHFELPEKKNPFQRRLNEHLPEYIPKVLRPYRKAKKFETTYYPDV